MPNYIDYDLNIDDNAKQIITVLSKHNFNAYVVGGAVRDLLINKKPKDFDVVTNANPQQIKKFFKKSRIIGKRFQIVHVYNKNGNFTEVTTFRNKEYGNKIKKRDNNFGTIITDAHRRDFTVNSMYYNLSTKQIIDWHNSLNDISKKSISVIGNANLRFNQDPVRILRAIRFKNKLDFNLSDETVSAIHDNKHLLQNVSSARLFEECLKLFNSIDAVSNYKLLLKFDIFKLLFPQTKNSSFIDVVLQHTARRVRDKMTVSSAFIFAVLLYNLYLTNLKIYNKRQKNKKKAVMMAITSTLAENKTYVAIPKFAVDKITNTWKMQHILESNTKKVDKIIAQDGFRMAYDFLLLRSKSIDKHLIHKVNFWSKLHKT